MPLIFRHHVSNKPLWGSIEIQEGEKKVYPLTSIYADGSQVAVSRPIIDRLAVMLPLSAELIDESLPTDHEYAAWLSVLMEGLYNAPGSQKGHSKIVKGMCWQAQVTLGSAAATFSLHRPTQTLPWQLRVECSPNKMGCSGVVSLAACLNEASGGMWDLKAARHASRVTRLDTAVDLVGGDVSDFVVRAPFAKKVVQYRDAEGVLETQYGAGTTTVDQKPLFGKVGYRFYDKRKELIARGFTPPFGDVPIARLERVQRFSAATPSLDALAQLPNPLSDVALVYVRRASKLHGWHDFVFLRAQYGLAQTTRVLGFPAALIHDLEAAYCALTFNAFDRQCWWGYWHESLADSALTNLFLAT